MLTNLNIYSLMRSFFIERLSSITKTTYLFVQQFIAIKLLDLDHEEYGKNSHRYRTRVDANAAALELLCLACEDEIGMFEKTFVYVVPKLFWMI